MAAGTLPFSTVFSSSRFSRVFCHWRVGAARHGNGDGPSARSRLCLVVGRGVCEGHVSILTAAESSKSLPGVNV
ncbi:hypothetical protein O9992_19705 [Vibrio lentus]|nr:hypothetical protein [Vibrio lentus]